METSATNSLADYINNNELQELSTSPSALTTCTTSTASSSSSLQNTINQQLNDLRIQFQNGIKHLQYKEHSTSLKPSLSMPELPLFTKLKTHKRKRAKPRQLLPIDDSENKECLSPSAQTSCSHYDVNVLKCNNNYRNSNNLMTYNNNEIKSKEINEKLDLLITIINSQQKLLENVIIQKNMKKRPNKKRKKTKTKSTQTNNIPHITNSPSYPSIPQTHRQIPSLPHNCNNNNNNVRNNGNSNNLLLPYDTLIKLVNAITNNTNQHIQYQHHHKMRMPQLQQNGYRPNNKQPNEFMSPRSTLYFSD
eukprot:357754_1